MKRELTRRTRMELKHPRGTEGYDTIALSAGLVIILRREGKPGLCNRVR